LLLNTETFATKFSTVTDCHLFGFISNIM